MYIIIKRFLDILFSVILIILLSPLLLLTAFLILITMKRPVIFKQVRLGGNNMLFTIYKFRTLTNKTDINLSEKRRLTRLGALLRKFSIDEYPQLFNILLGHMSFIGPRPLLPEYLPYYTHRETIRHNVRPGMSGLAQVNGRSNLTWDEQLELDAQYVKNLSFQLDVKIFFKTIPKVLRSADMQIIGRKDKDRFDTHRKKQIDSGVINPEQKATKNSF